MEFLKKNIHMDCCRYQTSTQITVEEDFVIPDVKSDMREVVFENCQIRMEDAKATDDHVGIQGEVAVDVLYSYHFFATTLLLGLTNTRSKSSIPPPSDRLPSPKSTRVCSTSISMGVFSDTTNVPF